MCCCGTISQQVCWNNKANYNRKHSSNFRWCLCLEIALSNHNILSWSACPFQAGSNLAEHGIGLVRSMTSKSVWHSWIFLHIIHLPDKYWNIDIGVHHLCRPIASSFAFRKWLCKLILDQFSSNLTIPNGMSHFVVLTTSIRSSPYKCWPARYCLWECKYDSFLCMGQPAPNIRLNMLSCNSVPLAK